MNLSLFQFGLRGFFRLVASAFVAGWVSSPMSWSPDGQWLCYTEVSRGEPDTLLPGWIFRTDDDDAPNAESEPPGEVTQADRAPSPSPAPAVYRIWATQPRPQVSVLIEESHWPLSAPAWSPRGKSIAFGRFVPELIESTSSAAKGRYEIVIQDALDRKRVVWSSTGLELDRIARDTLPDLVCSWSAEGTYLAIPLPGREPAIEIVRTDTKRRLHRIERAIRPSWSPDGSRCAFLRQTGRATYQVEYVERKGQTFGEPRVLTAEAVASPLHWSADGRSVFAVVELSMPGTHELEVVLLGVELPSITRLISLTPDPARRRARVNGFAIDFDCDGDRCFVSVDFEGRDCDLAWTIPRDKTYHKRFPPLDSSQRIKSIAVAPEGQLVAMRFATPSGLTAPAIYDSETDQTTLLVADHEARKAWLSFLAGTARQLLKAALPPAVADGQAARRPTLLPLPDELPLTEPSFSRVAKLARFGSALCSLPADSTGGNQPRQPAGLCDAETRLFFHYLRGDYPAATADLEDLDLAVSDPRERLGLLSIRAQLLWQRGEKSDARGVIDYLVSCEGTNRRLVEDTPFGPVVSPYTNPDQAWARYFSKRAIEHTGAPKAPAEGELPAELLDPRLQLQDNPALPEMPLIERAGVAPVPFVPR